MLSILVVIATNGHRRHGHQKYGLLLVSTILGCLGILGFAAYLFLSYFVSYGYNYGFYDVHQPWLWLDTISNCGWLLISFWYVLCIYGAMIEARETNTTGIVDGPSGVEMGQPGIEYNTVPVQGQQVYPTPSDPPPSYDELFPAMEQSSK